MTHNSGWKNNKLSKSGHCVTHAFIINIHYNSNCSPAHEGTCRASLPLPASAKVLFLTARLCCTCNLGWCKWLSLLTLIWTSVAAFSQAVPQPMAKGPLSAAGAGVPDAIAGALKRFGLKHPTRPVGVAKIDLASSFTDASSPANALSGVTSKPTAAAAGQQTFSPSIISCHCEMKVSHCRFNFSEDHKKSRQTHWLFVQSSQDTGQEQQTASGVLQRDVCQLLTHALFASHTETILGACCCFICCVTRRHGTG